MYFGNHKITDKWSLHTEYQFRRSDWILNWQQSLSRIGIDYKLNDKVMLTAGYGFITTFPYGMQPIAAMFNEHRIWQQLVITDKTGRVGLNHRFRMEERLLENKVLVGENYKTNGHTYLNRIRYRLLCTVPLNKSEMNTGTLFLALYDEIFVGFGKNMRYNIFDQNRLFAAVGYQYNKSGNLQLGYLNHIVLKSDGIRQETNHTLQVAVTHHFDFRRKQVDNGQ